MTYWALCPSCGWWKAIRRPASGGPDPRRMPKFAYQKFCQAGCLKALSPVFQEFRFFA